MSARVTVVIPTRNRRQLLLRTVQTVLAQDSVDLDVVVVDEGSTDGTAQALADLGHCRVTVVRHEQAQGVAAARNAGLEATETEWVAFVDDDDMWAPSKLAAQLCAITREPGARWACAGAVRVDARLRLGGPERAPASDISDRLLASNVIPGGASGVLARTDLVREVGGFDQRLSNMADYDLWIRLALASPVAGVDRPLVGYYVHSAGMAHNVPRSEEELALIEEKYRTIRQERGIGLHRDFFLWYFGSLLLRQGHRMPAVRQHLEIARRGGDRRLYALALAAAGGLWPGIQRLRDHNGSRRLPAAWRQEAESWIAPLRE